jgi:hypothetical protein
VAISIYTENISLVLMSYKNSLIQQKCVLGLKNEKHGAKYLSDVEKVAYFRLGVHLVNLELFFIFYLTVSMRGPGVPLII